MHGKAGVRETTSKTARLLLLRAHGLGYRRPAETVCALAARQFVRSGGPSMAILEVRGLVKIYGRRRVVDGVDFEVDRGEVVGLLGPNGAGKTTSFRMATGQLTPYAGHVWFNGQQVTGLPMYRRARLGMGYLSQ